MNVLVRIYEDDLTATRNVTAIGLVIAMPSVDKTLLGRDFFHARHGSSWCRMRKFVSSTSHPCLHMIVRLRRLGPNQLTANQLAPFSSELHFRHAEDEDEVVQVQDDCCHLVEFQSSSQFFRVSCFLVPSILSSLAFISSDDLPRKFLKGASRMVTRMVKYEERSVGRIQRSVFWSSKSRPD